MTATNTFTYADLKALLDGDAVAIGGVATLEPAGGPGDKIFPPTHAIEENKRPEAGAKYAFETRRILGKDATCVLIDSVQSQANRMEEALQALWDEKKIVLPVVTVDFTKHPTEEENGIKKDLAPEVGRVTSLTAPHRIADALLRDSLLGDQLFRLSEIGKSFTNASTKNATDLFRACPTGLVFGLWDSTGPKGGLGAKFQRALVSEIVGINAAPGSKTESRIDPLNILKKSADIYVAADESERWTTDVDKAKREMNDAGEEVPVKFGKEGKPSEVNHGNVTPSIDKVGGGVTIDEAKHTVVLSLAALRRLGFPVGASEARTVLAALGLLAVLAAEARGHDLRSRCLLVPQEGKALELKIVGRDGSRKGLALDLDGAIALYNEAVKQLPDAIKFEKPAGVAHATLTPSPKLAYLVQKSRELAVVESDATEP